VDAGAGCGDYEYSFYLSGDSIMGTRYQVLKEPDGGTATIIGEFTIGFGASEHVHGTIEDFCGAVRVLKFKPGSEDPWEDYTPPSGPPDSPPTPPPPPGNLPDPPEVPDAPGPGTNPTPPPTPGTPPSGGGGGDSEIIEWVKDTNVINRGISSRADVSNEYLKQIRDNTGYSADRLKTIDENTQVIADDVKRKADSEDAIKDATPTTSDMGAAGQAAAGAALEALGTLPSSNISATMTAPVFAITDPFTGHTFNMNPFTSDRFGPVALWLRKLALWLLVVGFAGWAALRGKETIVDIASAQQAKGNAVFAGTGGQATALIAAGLITVVVLAGIIGIVVWKDTVLQGSGGSVTTIMGLNPMESAPAACVWMIDQIVPVLTILAIAFVKVTFTFICTIAYVVAASIIRFIVP